jgi:CHAD domain-containing protein
VFGQPAGLNAVIAAPHTPARVRTRMPSVVWAAYDAVWAFDDVLAAADPTMLHQLRIVAKWLRYTLEFVREATEPEATPLIRAVEVVQDHLGTQHDLQVVATRAREFASGTGTLSAYERRSIERFTGHLDDAVERSARAWPSAWISLVVPAYRRRLGRALARL